MDTDRTDKDRTDRADKERYVGEGSELTERIIGCAYKVANALGAGFLEKVYENALAHELLKSGLRIEKQKTIEVLYDGVAVGLYVADIVVEERIIVEAKAISALASIHVAQALNYLKATGFHVALLINFGVPKIEIKRVVNSPKSQNIT